MEAKGFPPLNTAQRCQLRVLFPLCLPCRGTHFSSLAQAANIRRKTAGSQQREGAVTVQTGADMGWERMELRAW